MRTTALLSVIAVLASSSGVAASLRRVAARAPVIAEPRAAALTSGGDRLPVPGGPLQVRPAVEGMTFVGSRPPEGSRIVLSEGPEMLTLWLALIPDRSGRLVVTAEMIAGEPTRPCLGNTSIFWLQAGQAVTLAIPVRADPATACPPPFSTVALTACAGEGAGRTCRSFPARYTFVR